MDNPTGSLPGPLTSFDNTFSPRAGSLNAFSGPFSARNSTSSANSLPILPPGQVSQVQAPSSSALSLTTSALCNQMSSQHSRCEIPVDWATIDNEVGVGHIGSGGSDRSTNGAETHTTEAADSVGGMWSFEEAFAPSQTAERPQVRPGQLTSQVSGATQVNSASSGSISALKNNVEANGLKCMEPLLDALPRDITEMAPRPSD
jgi:hypothetical protein